MIAQLLRRGLSLLAYFCLATLIAQAVLFLYLAARYQPDRTKLIQILAILQDVDLFAMKEAAERDRDEISPEQVSYEQIIERRAVKVHHLELRERALKDGLQTLQLERRKLADEQQRQQQLKQVFEKQLVDMQAKETSEGMEDNRAKLESIKAKQAKELLVEMLNNDEIHDVVTLLKGMPNVKAAKIIGEFKTAEELQEISEVLRLIREGSPVADLAVDTRKELQQPKAAGP